MPFKKTALAMMMLGATAAQADYQVQLGAGYTSTSEEVEPDDSFYDYDLDRDELSAAATFYFSPVKTADGPLDEAEFLSKASGIAIGYVSGETDFDPKNFPGDSADSDAIAISGHFVLPNPNLIIEATYIQGENLEDDFDVYAFGFGGYITDQITLMGEYSKQAFDDYGDEDSIERFTITYRQLIKFGGEMGLALEPFFAAVDYFGEDGAEFGIDAAFYLNRNLGFKAGVSGFGADDDDDGEYVRAESYIGVDYFVNENFRVGGKLLAISSEYDSDYPEEDEESEGGGIEINAAVRF